jgi:hypothetical protein
MMNSLSSLKDESSRASSPSPFQPISGTVGQARSPTTSTSDPETDYEPAFNATVDTIKRGHLDAARQALRAGPLREELCEEIERDCETLRAFLNAANVSGLDDRRRQAEKRAGHSEGEGEERPTRSPVSSGEAACARFISTQQPELWLLSETHPSATFRLLRP